MAVTSSMVTALRELVGEPIPEDGEETDTFFTDDRLKDLLEAAGENLIAAAAAGWEIKVNEFAGYFNTRTGASSKNLRELYLNAKERLEYYSGLAGGAPGLGEAARVVGASAQILRYEPGPSGYPSAWPATPPEDSWSRNRG